MKINNILFIVLAVVLIWVYFSLPFLGLYANDGGTKYIQMKAFYLNKWQKLDIDYPGKNIGLDPAYLNPGRSFILKDDKLYISCSPLFTYLTSLFYPILGERVIHFFPLVSFFLSILILARILAIIIGKGLFYYVLIFCFSAVSPIFCYSIIFWEHLSAVLCCVLSLYCMASYFRKTASYKIFMSLLILGIGCFFRTGVFALVAAYVISLGFIFYKRHEFKSLFVMLLSSSFIILVYFLSNQIFYGNLLGLHAISHHPPAFSIKHIVFCLLGFLSAVLILIFFNRSRDKILLKKIYFIMGLLWVAAILIIFRNSPGPSLFIYFPLIFMVFFDIDSDLESLLGRQIGLKHFLLGVVIISISLISVFLHRNPDLSVRYMLIIIPYVVILLALTLKEITGFRPFYVLTVLLAVVSFIINFSELKSKILVYKYYNHERYEFLKSHTKDNDVIIFQTNPLMEHAGPLFFERIYIVSKNGGLDMGDMLKTLKEKNIRHCYYWTMNYDFNMDNADAKYEFKAGKNLPTQYLIKITL